MKSKILFIKYWPLIISIFTFTLFRLPYLNVVPFWDAHSVTACLLDAVNQKKFSLLNCHHPSIGYLFILSISQFIDFGSQYLLNTTNLILSNLSIVAFYSILKFFFSNKKLIFLSLLLLAFNPLFFGLSVMPNLDFAMTVFFLFTLSAFLCKRIFLFLVSGFLLCFSKEPGFLLYFIIAITYAIRILFSNEKPKKISFLFLITPLLIFAFYFIYQKYLVGSDFIWQGGTLIQFNLNRKWLFRIFTRFLQLFVLNFHWLYTLLIILGLLKIKKIIINNFFYWILLIICFFSFTLPILIFNTYVQPRYILPMIPVLILFAVGAISVLFRNLQKLLLLLILVIFSTLQTFDTVDPVSRFLFTTVKFGKHEILKMTRFVNECCGKSGKDQIGYNAQFLAIDGLISKFSKTIKINNETILFAGDLDVASLFGPVDKIKYERTLRTNNIIYPKVYITADLIYFSKDSLPQNAFYIYTPWNDLENEQLERLKPYYKIYTPLTVEKNGYILKAYPLNRK